MENKRRTSEVRLNITKHFSGRDEGGDPDQIVAGDNLSGPGFNLY